MIIHMLQAGAGDCFVIDFENGKCVLIDGGIPETYSDSLKPLLQRLNSEGKCIENLICTHFDNDHIGGLLKFVTNNGDYKQPCIIRVEHIICNHFEEAEKILSTYYYSGTRDISYHQQQTFEELCSKNHYPMPAFPITENTIIKGTGYSLRFVAPSQSALDRCKEAVAPEQPTNERNSISATIYDDIEHWKSIPPTSSGLNVFNKASLAFELITSNRMLLFCGDADMNTYRDNLHESYDLIKLSHHGTYHGNECFIGKDPIIADKYIISTSSTRYYHPERPLLAGVLLQRRHKEIILNYNLFYMPTRGYRLLDNSEQQVKYNFSATVQDRIEIGD